MGVQIPLGMPSINASVADVVIADAWRASERGSIPRGDTKVYVTVVQRIEQLPSKQWVAGSSPASHASIYASVVEWYTQQT